MASKFNMNKNPVYQVDYSVTSSGKKLALTKRRVRWVFGYSNAEAISSGLTGVDCRGEEHEVILIWSVTSSKRVLRIDGEDIHYSIGRLADTKFEFTHSIRGGHLLKVTAHLMRPIGSTSDFKQYDLQLDGLSYFEMPRLFQLGKSMCLKEYQPPQLLLESKGPSKSEGRPQTYANYKVENQETYPAFSKSRAVTDASKAINDPTIQVDLFSSSISAPNEHVLVRSVLSQPTTSSVPSPMQHFQPLSNTVPTAAIRPTNPGPQFMPYQVQASVASINSNTPQSVGSMSQQTYYESAHSRSSYDDLRNRILDCYELSSPPSLAYSEEFSRSQSQDCSSLSSSHRESSPTHDFGYYDKTTSGYGSNQKTMYEYGSNEKAISGYGSTNLDEAFKTLVNLENMSKPQPQSTSLKQETQPSLNQMKHSSNIVPIKEVMKPVAMMPYDPATSYGAMVPYGVSSSYSNYMVNPPPLQKVSGFGVGASISYDTSYGNRSAPHFWSH